MTLYNQVYDSTHCKKLALLTGYEYKKIKQHYLECCFSFSVFSSSNKGHLHPLMRLLV